MKELNPNFYSWIRSKRALLSVVFRTFVGQVFFLHFSFILLAFPLSFPLSKFSSNCCLYFNSSFLGRQEQHGSLGHALRARHHVEAVARQHCQLQGGLRPPRGLLRRPRAVSP